MKIKKVEMISNAISENTRYLPSASVRKLYNFMIDKKYIDEDNLIFREKDDSKIDYKATIIKYINEIDELMNWFDDHEYTKTYKYGVARTINIEKEVFHDRIKKLLDDNHVTLEHEYKKSYDTPELITNGKVFTLKFNYLLGSNPNGAGWFAYPILADVFIEEKILLIRFDSVPNKYFTHNDFYKHVVRQVKSWVERFLIDSSSKIDFIDCTKKIIQEKNDDAAKHVNISEYIRDSYDNKGGRVKMIANDKDKMTLVDKLNEIAGKMTIEVERKLLLDYIREISNNMFFIERGFIWNSFGGKQVKLIMTFRESFIESEMQLIHFYEDKWNRERVIDGLEYIINGGIE